MYKSKENRNRREFAPSYVELLQRAMQYTQLQIPTDEQTNYLRIAEINLNKILEIMRSAAVSETLDRSFT